MEMMMETVEMMMEKESGHDDGLKAAWDSRRAALAERLRHRHTTPSMAVMAWHGPRKHHSEEAPVVFANVLETPVVLAIVLAMLHC